MVTFDVKTKQVSEPIFSHPEVDISDVRFSDTNKKIVSVSYNAAKVETKFFDKTWAKVYKTLKSTLPNQEVQFSSASKDETQFIVRTFSDKTRGAYYYYDLKGNFRLLAELSPWLNEDELAEMKPITYKSRDGLTIHGYLTLPKGKDPKGLPVVVNPHGGPWARDSWGFRADVQMLANRGYAVLQMNFRGSTGYGKKFWEASFKQWGQKMQDDITDGVNWLVEQGIADKDRVCIYGGSYGGYAVLSGLTVTPDLYACGVDFVGISSLFTFIESFPPYWKIYLEMIYEMVGHPEKDKEMFTKYSPVLQADKIKAPLFVAQGANDPRVKKAESDQMVAALKKRGVSVEYMVKDDEGHGFRNEENRLEFYKRIDVFLEKHLQKKSPSML